MALLSSCVGENAGCGATKLTINLSTLPTCPRKIFIQTTCGFGFILVGKYCFPFSLYYLRKTPKFLLIFINSPRASQEEDRCLHLVPPSSSSSSYPSCGGRDYFPASTAKCMREMTNTAKMVEITRPQALLNRKRLFGKVGLI